MLKNYNVFINESNENKLDLSLLSANEIHKMILVRKDDIQEFDDFVEYDVIDSDYRLEMGNWYKSRWDNLLEKGKTDFTKIFYEKNGEKIQYVCSFKDAYELAKRLDKIEKKEARGSNIEYMQKLGLILEMPKGFSYYNDMNINYFRKIPKSYFNTNLLNNDTLVINDYPIKTLEDYKLVSGSFKFKNHIEYTRKEDFKIAKVLHKSKSSFAKKLQNLENKVANSLEIEFHTDKVNTADIFLLDNKDVESYISALDIEKSIVLSEPVFKSEREDLNEKGYYEGGICYIIPQDKLSIDELIEKTSGINYNTELDKYDNILNDIINEYKDVSLKFIQVTLKKSKTGAQFGKVTKTLKRIIKDLNENNIFINEGIVSFFDNLYNKVKTFFGILFKKYDKKVEKLTDEFVLTLENNINNQLSHINESVYIPKKIENEIISKDLFICYKDNGAKGFRENNIENKMEASYKIDKLCADIINNAEKYLKNNKANKFHEKFADVLSVGLMGATNLPMYMVFGSSSKKSNTFTLHHYRINKNIKQVYNAIERKRRNKPMYAIYIVDHTKNGQTYRNMNILIYNYSSSTKQYISVIPRTNSTKHSNISAETKSTDASVEKYVLDEYKKMKNIKGL